MIYRWLPLLSISFLFSCTKVKVPVYDIPAQELSVSAVIPIPESIENSSEVFPLDKTTLLNFSNESLRAEADYLVEKLNQYYDISLSENPSQKREQRVINLSLDNETQDRDQSGYKLHVTRDTINIRSTSSTGIFNGINTLLQLIPQESIDTFESWSIYPVAGGIISDQPAFQHRGMMLDIARHFFTTSEIKRLIDHLALFKINKLHLHLTDDQGWRIEIKSWPKLAEVGGKYEVGGTPGGYLTQEDFKDIVKHASLRHIEIIPEIDMPGHTNAAAVAYPVLNGAEKEAVPYFKMRVGFSTLNTRKDSTYVFVEDVIKELAAISPSPYIHIGGDESFATKDNDYQYFIERVEKIADRYDKKIIGWDEIITAEVSKDAVVQFWRGEENLKSAFAKGNPVILTPAFHTYLDMKYTEDTPIGLKWAGLIPVEKSYQWSTSDYVNVDNAHILGIEAPLWSETVEDINDLQYLAFPRILSIAEKAWSPAEKHNWSDFKNRLLEITPILDQEGIKFYRSPYIWRKPSVDPSHSE